MNRVAIMGPSIFSWGGFFSLLSSADIFVLYDDQPYTRNDLSNRNRIIVSKNKVGYITIPYQHTGKEYVQYSDLILLANNKIRDKYLRGIQMIYSKYKGFAEISSLISDLPWEKPLRVIDFQMAVFDKLRKYIPTPKILLSSSINKKGRSNDLVESILYELKADSYLSAFNSYSYNHQYAMNNSSYNYQYQQFISQPYNQPSKDFIPNLSFIDIVACIGLSSFNKYLISSNKFLTLEERKAIEEKNIK